MTLAEFLLARIADEEKGTRPGTVQNGVFSGIMQHYGLDESDDDDQAEAGEITDAVMAYLEPRVLAECEAKRRIVDWCRHVEVDPAHRVADGVLRLLALPDADHPDYLPEWRPGG